MYKEMLKYQIRENDLIKIEKELGASPERKRLIRAKNFLNDFDANIASMDCKAHELMAEFKKINEKSSDLAKQLEEYANMSGNSDGEDEHNYFIKKVSKFEEKITLTEKDLTQVTADIKLHLQNFDDYRKKVKLAKEEYNSFKSKYDELKNARKCEALGIQKDLSEIESKIPDDLFKKYKNVRAKKIYPALVPLAVENCGGCRMELSMNRISELKAKTIIECEECNRLIYIEN